MAKRNLLLVDADPRSLRVLEVSLRKAGYSITTCGDVDTALELLDLSEPDMIIADTLLSGKDGFVLVSELKSRPALSQIPLMFLSSDPSVQSKVRSLELGIQDFLTKPVAIREILTRVNLVMERKERDGRSSKTRFTGSLEDMGLVDLLQTIDLSRKSGLLKLSSGPRRGSVTFSDGRVMDAELGKLRGEAAIYRFLLWNEGSFELEFREVTDEDKLGISTQALLMEGVRRLDEWGRLQEQLPGLHAVLEVNHAELMDRLGEIPDELNNVLRAFDGQRDLTEVLELSDGDDLVTLMAISKLFFDGFLSVRHRTEPSADAQVGGESDPFLGLLPTESLPPEGAPEPSPPGAPRHAVSSPSGQLHEREGEPIHDDGVRTSSSPARAVKDEATVGVRAAGRVPLAVVQLKRVPAITGLSTGSSSSTSSSSGSSIPAESEGDTMKRSKRRAEREEQRPSGNVIPLHTGFRDSAAARDERGGAARSERGEDDTAEHATRSVEQKKTERSRDEHPRDEVNESGMELKEPGARASEPHGELHHEDDPLDVRDFFSRTLTSMAPSGEPWSDFDGMDHEVPHAPPHRRAMLWTAGIAAAGLVLIGIFLLYNKVLMPTPEEFAFKRPIALPTPDMLKDSFEARRAAEPRPPVEPAPVAEPAPAAEPTPAAEPSTVAALAAIAAAPAAAFPSSAQAAAAVPASPTAVTPDSAPSMAGSESAPADYTALLADARKLGFRKAAEEQYLKALQLNPGGADALSGLAMLYLNQGKNQQARERSEQALALSPVNDEGWIVLGAAQSALGKERAARDAYAHCAALPTGKYVAECKRLLH